VLTGVKKEDGDGSASPDGVRKFTAPAAFLLRAFERVRGQNERGMRRGSAAQAGRGRSSKRSRRGRESWGVGSLAGSFGLAAEKEG